MRERRRSILSVALLMPLLKELEDHGIDGLWTILDIVSMYLYGGENTATKELLILVKRVLVAPVLMTAVRNNMDGYHMEQMVVRLVKLGAIDETYAKKLAKQVMSICRQGKDRVFYDLDDPARKILNNLMALHPVVVWKEVTKKLISRSWHDRFYAENLLEARHHDDDYLGRGLSFNVPSHIYMDWVREKPGARASKAVAWLPIAEKDDSGQLKWHSELEAFVAEFGDHQDVMSAISQRLMPSTYVGGLIRYIEPVVTLVESWSTHSSSNIRSWVARQLDWLQKTIAEETKRSEEDVVRYS